MTPVGYARLPGSPKNVDGRDIGVRSTPSFRRLCPATRKDAIVWLSTYSRRVSSQWRRYTAAKARSSSLACFIALS
jgi:hypothetical protein